MHLFGLEISKAYLIDYFITSEREDNNVSRNINDFLNTNNIPSEILTCDNSMELFYNLGWIAKECNGTPVLLHLFGHGNQAGIGNNIEEGSDKISVNWNILNPFLSKINSRTNNQLILNMMTPCFGCSINDVITDPPAYRHGFGTQNENSRAVANHCNDLYRRIIVGRNSIQVALYQTNGLCGDLYAIF